MAGLIVYLPDGTEYYNSNTHPKLVFQEELVLTGWVEEIKWTSYYVDVPYVDPNIHYIGSTGLIVAKGRIYWQAVDLSLQNVYPTTVVTTPLFRII